MLGFLFRSDRSGAALLSKVVLLHLNIDQLRDYSLEHETAVARMIGNEESLHSQLTMKVRNKRLISHDGADVCNAAKVTLTSNHQIKLNDMLTV